jgi:hypothetical protein
MARVKYLILLVLGALALAAVASGAASETGVTSTQVTIGGTTPLSGPASAYQSVAKGAAAYFRYVNAKGGVNKRTTRPRRSTRPASSSRRTRCSRSSTASAPTRTWPRART